MAGPNSATIVTGLEYLDVDHTVPLANAHDSGARQCPPERNGQYANYLGDPQHVIAVIDSTNRSKGAAGPDR